MLHRTLPLALLAALGPAPAQEPAPAPAPAPAPEASRAVEFVDLSLADALSRAERERRLLLVFWGNQGYRDVERMRRTTWRDPDLAAWVMRHALAVEVDGPSETTAVAAYRVTAYPTVDLLDPTRGVGVERLQGYVDADGILAAFAGALVGGGPAPRPEGAALADPYAWLAYANSMWRQPDEAAEAARAYGWALRNGEEHRPGFRRRYFEFLLTRLAYLKPRAMEAYRILDAERLVVEGRVFRGVVDERTVYELVRLDWWLRDEERTRQTFLDLAGRGESAEIARARLLRHVVHDLGRQGQTAELLAGLADTAPDAWLRARLERIDAGLARQAEGEALLAEEVDSRADAVLGASWIYDSLLDRGRGADAAAVVDVVAELAPSPRAFALLVDRARERGLHELAIRVGKRGLAALEDDVGARQLRRALAKVPGYSAPDDGASDDGAPDDGRE